MTTTVRAATEEELEYLRGMPSALVRDITLRLNIGGCIINGPLPLRLFGFGNKHVAGPARTVQFAPQRGTGLKTYNIYTEVIPSCKPGEVLVLAGNAMASWAAGENQCNHSMQYGLAAWVTDLGMRDVAEIREMGFPVICSNPTPNNVAQEIVAVDVPVYLAGAQVRAGDIIVADDDGAVVLPIESLDQVLPGIREKAAAEMEQEKLIKSKAPPQQIADLLSRTH